ncbi:signal recognition particle protein [soil metagenome]
MFENLSERLSKTIRNLSGRGRLTEDNIKETMREIRMALLEADVALPIVRQFIEDVQVKAIGQEVMKSLTPGQALVKIVYDELVKLLGDSNEELALNAQPPAIILLVGLQGSGKTTTIAKLARWLKERKNKRVLVTSTDIYRPAAIEQLATLAKNIDVAWHPSNNTQKPTDIVAEAIAAAKKQVAEVLLIDTAGRLHIDAELMLELQQIHALAEPIETILVVDSMIGQDATNVAKAFNELLPLTGIILTKTDGDARGGAALSMRLTTGKPIKFIGSGEKTQALEPFYPDRIASRILGMGDILSLVEEAEQNLDREKADKWAQKLKKGKSFDLEDFLEQIQQMNKMGGMMGLLNKLPGMSALPQNMKNQMDDSLFTKIVAIINSMTPHERRHPDLIRGSRKRRIALGSGTDVPDVNRLLKRFEQMQKMMKSLSKRGNMMKMMRGMQGVS